MDILLANPRGFCAGVDRAIEIVERAIEALGAPIYVRHEVVHNRFVVNRLRDMGAVFVEELDEVPDDSTVIFSAHGVSKAVQQEADRRGLQVFDATCPLVTKVHIEVAKYSKENRDVVLIGHKGHPEVEGTMGQFEAKSGGRMHLVETPEDVWKLEVQTPDSLAYVTQTTLSVDDTAAVIDELRKRFPAVSGPRKNDICYATQNRQDTVKQLVKDVDVLLVVGSANSSNSNRLREIAVERGVAGYLIDGPEDMQQSWFADAKSVGLTAGASAPEVLVKRVIDQLVSWGGQAANEIAGTPENVVFSVPKNLLRLEAQKVAANGAATTSQ